MRPFEKSVLLKIGSPPIGGIGYSIIVDLKLVHGTKWVLRIDCTRLRNCISAVFFSRCLSQEFSGFSVIVWVNKTLWIWHSLPINPSLEIPELFSICGSYRAEITRVIRSILFLHVRNSIHSACIYFSFFSWYFEIVWPQVCFRFCRRCVIVTVILA